ncbi:flagellar basal body rod protein FlgC [Shimia thalassica]|uniref:flagellar basal body rod protein FlgC n=1 Tax=Shimia thalassica TaxID=1715693 RepID=UPI001C08A909|nr:flagellar basal body rod protein FlgC [Shimia thalassica]MBU2942353.1 flagellar basal body rod protein FlgC [Shimia thalassica]MDO6504281.1 flagellar basal body rod protein FlgC [Shimia thalassica]MDP2495643.1 flagellar basal body rod protein FlgC [Shimia thalassica]MDP2581186.1 flagellar basal body rod protein FlgC [Shimia thalassica]
MSDFSSALHLSSSGLRAQAKRLRHVSENIANADTPGYRRKNVPFQLDTGSPHNTVRAGKVRLDPSELHRVYDPSHPLADHTGFFESSNVDVMVEIADAREAQRSYEANLKMFEQTRQMSSSLMDLLRK